MNKRMFDLTSVTKRVSASKYLFMALLFSLPGTVMTSCNTGIESTKKIELSKEEKKSLKATPEELYMSSIKAESLKDWKQGKRFIASDDKTALIFDSSGLPADLSSVSMAGRLLEFRRLESSLGFDGKEEAVIVFSDGERDLRYKTGKDPKTAMESILSSDIPLTIDVDMINAIADHLSGKEFWIKTPLWYDSAGSKIDGRKFVKVRIEEVVPGNMVFPVKIKFTDDQGATAYLFMNYGNKGIESRNFPSLFSLSDIRLNYHAITDENWELIRNGKIRAGMTKLECKLSLGNPTEVNSGHDWNSTIDIWQYTDGVFLRFQDGLLVDFRR